MDGYLVKNYNRVLTAEISGWPEHFLTYIDAYEGIENTFADLNYE